VYKILVLLAFLNTLTCTSEAELDQRQNVWP